MHIIEQIGSYAGLAAVVGLAVLSVLYFSQARDVRRLREWAGRAPERAEAGQPVPAAVAQRVVAQPQPKLAVPGQAAPTPGQPAPAGGGAAPPPVPGAPVVGVPALASAAGARPATATASAGTGPATPAGQGQQAPQAEKGAGDEADTGESLAGSDTGEAAAPDDAVPVTAGAADGRPAAATPAAQAAGVQARPQSTPAPVSAGNRDSTEETDAVPPIAAATAAAIQSPPPANSGAATPAAQSRPPLTPPPPSASPRLPERSAPPPRVPPGSETRILPPPGRPPGLASSASDRPSLSGPRLAALIVAGVLVVGGGAAFGISQLTSDDTSGSGAGSPAAPGADGSGGSTKAKARPVDPSKVTVAVLNGTLVPGLAANIGDQVTSGGFDLGTVANSSDQEQQRAESVVLYAKGHEREAAAVGRRLKIPQREAIDADTQALAGDASVVVIAGSDLTQ
jgi:hypothetical protein